MFCASGPLTGAGAWAGEVKWSSRRWALCVRDTGLAWPSEVLRASWAEWCKGLGLCCLAGSAASYCQAHVWWEREKLGAEAPEIISTLIRKLLGLLPVITHTQLALPTSFLAQSPCPLLKGLSSATYYSDLLSFPLESGAHSLVHCGCWLLSSVTLSLGVLRKAQLRGRI